MEERFFFFRGFFLSVWTFYRASNVGQWNLISPSVSISKCFFHRTEIRSPRLAAQGDTCNIDEGESDGVTWVPQMRSRVSVSQPVNNPRLSLEVSWYRVRSSINPVNRTLVNSHFTRHFWSILKFVRVLPLSPLQHWFRSKRCTLNASKRKIRSKSYSRERYRRLDGIFGLNSAQLRRRN